MTVMSFLPANSSGYAISSRLRIHRSRAENAQIERVRTIFLIEDVASKDL